MDLGVFVAVIGSMVAVGGVMGVMIFLVRQELNLLRVDKGEIREGLLQSSRNIENALGAIQAEMRDFHFRLIEIERKKK